MGRPACPRGAGTTTWVVMALALAAALAAVMALAIALRPWRVWPARGAPWPWLAWPALMPVLWNADRLSSVPLAQPLPGACLLMLMAGWPLAMLMLLPVTLGTALLGGLGAGDVLARSLWLGVAPATLGMLLGAAVRRWLPAHLFVYILGRGFMTTVLANMAAGGLQALAQPLPQGLGLADLLLARWLAGWGDAIITGMMVAIFVAFRPQWLATYADRLYLPPPGTPRTPDPPPGEPR